MEKGDWVRVNVSWSAYRDCVGRVAKVEGGSVWVTFKPDDRELKFDADCLIRLAAPEQTAG